MTVTPTAAPDSQPIATAPKRVRANLYLSEETLELLRFTAARMQRTLSAQADCLLRDALQQDYQDRLHDGLRGIHRP